MGTTIYLIRHGEVEGANPRRYNGHIEVPLSARGEEQIGKLASFLSGKDDKRESAQLDAVYCSSLIRAKKTAEIIAKPFGLEPIVADGLKERSFGEWEGMSFDEVNEKWPEAFKAWADDPLKFSPIGGESTLETRERAVPAFNKIVDGHKDGAIAVISHGGVTRVILCEMLGIPLENIFRIEQDFGALNVIEIWDYPVVKRINYVV